MDLPSVGGNRMFYKGVWTIIDDAKHDAYSPGNKNHTNVSLSPHIIMKPFFFTPNKRMGVN